jgi:membrane protein DedA with SNARE-associated domain
MSDWIIGFVESGGYWGIALLMALENIFPPVPSELIMPFAGFVAARGDLNVVGVVIAGVVGSLVGTMPWYWLGRRVGRERLHRWVDAHGRWFAMSRQDLERAEKWFDAHGGPAVAFGRLIPAVRSVISMPAGLSKMPVVKLLLWSAIGTVLWSGALAGVGYLLEDRWESIAHWVDRLSTGVLVLLVAVYVWRVVRFKPEKG